jgi:plasmid stabilization system protein ParE
MPYPLRYRAEAEAEISNAYFWFEEQQPGLGLRFLNRLEELDARIGDNPDLFQVVEPPDVRRGLMRRFPYSLFDRIQGQEVDVLACLHQHQRPKTREELIGRS